METRSRQSGSVTSRALRRPAAPPPNDRSLPGQTRFADAHPLLRAVAEAIPLIDHDHRAAILSCIRSMKEKTEQGELGPLEVAKLVADRVKGVIGEVLWRDAIGVRRTRGEQKKTRGTRVEQKKKACEMRRPGEASWRYFESRSDAAKEFGIRTSDVTRLIKGPLSNMSERIRALQARSLDNDEINAEISAAIKHCVARVEGLASAAAPASAARQPAGSAAAAQAISCLDVEMADRPRDDELCTICQAPLGANATALPCGHCFHASCLARLADNRGATTRRRGVLTACPNCRSSSNLNAGELRTQVVFEVGTAVEARYGTDSWYLGMVVAVLDDAYRISWEGSSAPRHLMLGNGTSIIAADQVREPELPELPESTTTIDGFVCQKGCGRSFGTARGRDAHERSCSCQDDAALARAEQEKEEAVRASRFASLRARTDVNDIVQATNESIEGEPPRCAARRFLRRHPPLVDPGVDHPTRLLDYYADGLAYVEELKEGVSKWEEQLARREEAARAEEAKLDALLAQPMK